MNIKQFEFEVGRSEKHCVTFYFNQTIGNLRISVDGTPVIRKFRMFSLSTEERFEFSVGDPENHAVLIKKTRKRILGGFVPQVCSVFVDGVAIGDY
jgi:Fas apoptotic inhibitory molecule (FAIM1)